MRSYGPWVEAFYARHGCLVKPNYRRDAIRRDAHASSIPRHVVSPPKLPEDRVLRLARTRPGFPITGRTARLRAAC